MFISAILLPNNSDYHRWWLRHV